MVIKNIYFTLLGDISRCFKQKETSVLFSNIQILGGVATVLTPSSFILFNKVDLNLLGLHVNKSKIAKSFSRTKNLSKSKIQEQFNSILIFIFSCLSQKYLTFKENFIDETN